MFKGRFIGFPGGDINDIQKPAIRNGVLSFTPKKVSPSTLQHAKLEGVYKQRRGAENGSASAAPPENRRRDDAPGKKASPLTSSTIRNLRLVSSGGVRLDR